MAKDKWLVIDSHTHFLPQAAVAKTGVCRGFDYTALFKGEMAIPYKRIQDIEATLRWMEEAGVDMAVLNQSAWSGQGLEICKAMNDGYDQLKRDYPGKFILCGHVPLQGGQAVVDEVDRCINELGLHGMSLVSSVDDVFLNCALQRTGAQTRIKPRHREPFTKILCEFERDFLRCKQLLNTPQLQIDDLPDLG